MKINDKVLHFGVGFLIAIIVTLLSAPVWGALVGALAGLGKEIWDEYKYGGGDFFDLIATVSGAWAGVMGLHLFQVFIL